MQFGVLKSDTERALVALRDAVQVKFPNLSVENATKGESASNGLIEATIGKMESQARTLKSALQARYGVEIGPKYAILPWLVDYAGATLSRYARGADGRTPYERSARKPWRLQVPEFGECIWYQPLKGEKVGSKLEPKFEKGIFLGVQEGSALKWVGTEAGVVRAWSIKRRPDDERWVVDELNHMIGLPWQLKPPAEASKKLDAGGGIDLQVAIEDPPSQPVVVREKRKKGYVPRGIYIRKDIELQQFGYTPGCDGCIAAQRGLGHRQHSSTCKERIAAELEKTDEGKMRLELIRKREEEFIVRHHVEEERKRKADASPSAPVKMTRADEPSLEDCIVAVEQQGAPSSSPHPGVASGPGSPVELAPAGSLPADAPPGADAAMDDGGGEDMPPMDVGALEVLCRSDGLKKVDPDFVGCLREASYIEAIDLLADEEVSKTKLELQRGVLSVAAAYGLTKPEVAELYSPPRVTDFGERKGILSGVAFDLTTNDEDGNPWDFRLEGQRQKAAQKIEEMQPDLLIGSPMCGPYSNLHNLNMRTPEGRAKVQQNEEEGDQHLDFCAQQYEAQMDRGGYFIHEHPRSARSWKRPCIERLAARDDVFVVTGDLCRYGLRSQDEWGDGPSKKPTSFMTNSPEIAKELSLRCTNQNQAMGVWKEFKFNLRVARGPRTAGPHRRPVVRRVILDVVNMVVLQDLKEVQGATKEQWEFRIPKHCREVQIINYYVKKGYTYHRHIPLTDGRAKFAQVYPEGLVRAIVQGLLRQLRKPTAYVCGVTMGPINQENDIDFSLFDSSADGDWDTFVDEVSGKPLKTSLVEAARAEELEFAKRYNVWDLTSVQECWDRTGAGPIGSRWIDINKGDEVSPAYRSRLVIQEIRHSGIEAIFAATPPLESVRFFVVASKINQEEAQGHVLSTSVELTGQLVYNVWCTFDFHQMFVGLTNVGG